MKATVFWFKVDKFYYYWGWVSDQVMILAQDVLKSYRWMLFKGESYLEIERSTDFLKSTA